MAKKLTFEEKKELILSKEHWKDDRKIVDRWYELEGTEFDISTERLGCMVADTFGWTYEDVMEVMCYFGEEFAKIKEEK